MTWAAAASRMDAIVMRTFGDQAALDGVPVVGVFDNPYTEISGMSTGTPIFQVRSGGIDPTQASTLQIHSGPGAGLWRVRSVEPDGTGVTVLSLERAT